MLTLFIFCFKSYSQNIEELKKVDTIYIYFKNNSIHERKDIYDKMKVKRLNKISYVFTTDFYNTIFFNSSEYKDSDSYINGIKNDVKILKKKFLRKNKNIILDIDFFIKNGFKQTFFAALYGKTVYIIDRGDTKKGKVKLKQVSVMSNYIEE